MWVSSRSQNVDASCGLLHLVLPNLPVKPLLRLCCISPIWNGYISNQFFFHSHCLHPRHIFGFFFHHRRSGDTFYESETPAYAPFDCTDHALPNPALSFLPKPIAVAASTQGSTTAATSLAGTMSATPPPPLGSPSRHRLTTTVPPSPSPSSSMSQASTTSTLTTTWSAHIPSPAATAMASMALRPSPLPCESGRHRWISAPPSGSLLDQGGKAYWRMTMEEVVAYNPVGNTWRSITRLWANLKLMVWELEEMGGRVSCTCMKAMSVTAWVMGIVGFGREREATEWW